LASDVVFPGETTENRNDISEGTPDSFPILETSWQRRRREIMNWKGYRETCCYSAFIRYLSEVTEWKSNLAIGPARIVPAFTLFLFVIFSARAPGHARSSTALIVWFTFFHSDFLFSKHYPNSDAVLFV
jgi:hypothetical protein